MIDNKSVLGERTRQLRHDLYWSQEKVARKVGVDRSYISQIETGHVGYPGSQIVRGLADVLGSTTDYLLGLTDDPLPPPEIQPDDLPENYRFLYKRIEHLPPAMRDQAIEYLIEEIERMERLMQLGRRLDGETMPTPA